MLYRHWADFVALQQGTRLLWAPVWFGLGIALHFWLPWSGQRLALDLALIFVLLLLLARLRRPSLPLLLPLVLCLMGGLRLEMRSHEVASPVLSRPVTVSLTAEVLQQEIRAAQRQRLFVRPMASSRPLPRLRIVQLAARAGLALRPGDVIELKARLSPPPGPSLPGGFDRARRDWFRGIGAHGIVLGPLRKIQSVAAAPDSFSIARQTLSQQMQRAMPGDAGAVAAAMMTGDSTPLSKDAERDLQVTSLYHLLSVSGFHLAIITGLVFVVIRHGLAFVPRLALNWPLKQLAAIVAMLAAIAYTLFTGAAWPTVRACIATLLVMLAIVLGRQPFSLRLIAFAAVIILAWRPEALVDVSFQFSFAAVSGLVAAQQSQIGQRLSLSQEDDSLLVWAARKIGLMALLSFAAEAAIAPIALLHFHQMGIYGVIANALAAPLATYVIMPLGMLTAALAPVHLEGLTAPWLSSACSLLLFIAQSLGQWPSARLTLADPGTLAFVLALAGLLLLLLVRGAVKWSGLVCVMLAALAAWARAPADIRISRDARQVMLRTEAGSLVVSDERGASAVRGHWSEVHGFAPEWTWVQGGLGFGVTKAAPRCGGEGCMAQVQRGSKHWRIAVFGPGALPVQCPAADVLIDGRNTRRRACTAPLTIDRRWMAAQGVTALRFTRTEVQIESDRERRGDRPWARGLWGDAYDPLDTG